MTRKDYKIIAEVLGAAYSEAGATFNNAERNIRTEQVLRVRDLLCRAFLTDNSNFNKQTFNTALMNAVDIGVEIP